MCNIAGYVGNRTAAPILIDMMRREEGYAGGYYTGIATIHEGKLYYAKVVGDTDRLLAQTDAMNFPGTIGIIHSRSNSGGDVEWGHPFISNDRRFALVINGISGLLCSNDMQNAAAQSIEADGFKLASKAAQVAGYPTLADGSGVHSSEIRCHGVDRYIKRGLSPADAMHEAFLEMPAEIVGLALHEDAPDRILAARYTQPMMIARACDGTYLASTALAFPSDVSFIGIGLMPAACTAEFYADRYTIRGFNKLSHPIAHITTEMTCAAREYVKKALEERGGEPAALMDLMKDSAYLWPEGQATQRWAMWYFVIEPMIASGEINVVKRIVAGADPNIPGLNLLFTNDMSLK